MSTGPVTAMHPDAEVEAREIRRTLGDAPKTLAWRARWYELPEEEGGPGRG